MSAPKLLEFTLYGARKSIWLAPDQIASVKPLYTSTQIHLKTGEKYEVQESASLVALKWREALS